MSQVVTEACKSKKRKHKIIERKFSKYVAKDGLMHTEFSELKPKYGELATDEYHSFYLERHRVRNGDRPQRYSRAPDLMINFYYKYKSVFEQHYVDIDRGIVVSGCFIFFAKLFYYDPFSLIFKKLSFRRI